MKHLLLAITLLVTFALDACTTPAVAPTSVPIPTSTSTIASKTGEEVEVRDLVENFGKRLQMVSLLAPDAVQDLQRQYSEFVSPALLETWMKAVSKAPGRMVSSPWPDRIRITTLTRETPDRYVVDGYVIEITSTEIAGNEAANEIPVHIVVEKDQGYWLITEYAEKY